MTNLASIHRFAINMIRVPLTSNSYASRPCAISELAFLFAIDIFNDLSWLILIVLISTHLVRINVTLENLSHFILFSLSSIRVISIFQLSRIKSSL